MRIRVVNSHMYPCVCVCVGMCAVFLRNASHTCSGLIFSLGLSPVFARVDTERAEPSQRLTFCK